MILYLKSHTNIAWEGWLEATTKSELLITIYKFGFFQARSFVYALILFIHIYLRCLFITLPASWIKMSWRYKNQWDQNAEKFVIPLEKACQCWFQGSRVLSWKIQFPKKDLIATLPQDTNSWIWYVGHKCRATLILYELHILKHLFVLKIICQDYEN